MTSWADRRAPDFKHDRPGRPVPCSNASADWPSSSATPLATRCSASGVVISLSNGGSTWSCNSTTVTVDAAPHQVLGQFQPDETGPDHDRPLDPVVDPILDAVHVLEVAQREDAGQVDARDRRPQGGRPGARISLS